MLWEKMNGLFGQSNRTFVDAVSHIVRSEAHQSSDPNYGQLSKVNRSEDRTETFVKKRNPYLPF